MFMVRKLKAWLAEPVESTVAQVPRALVASILALFLDFGLLLVLVEKLGFPAVPAAVFGYLAGGVLQYVLCSIWVFNASAGNNATGFVAFTVLSLVGLGITWTVMALFHDVGGIPYPAAKCAALGLAFSWNFLSRKYLLFRASAPAAELVIADGARR
jgi:putative flippase GtrA